MSIAVNIKTIRKVGLCSLIERSEERDDANNPVYEVLLEGEGVMHRSTRLSDASSYFRMLLGDDGQVSSENS